MASNGKFQGREVVIVEAVRTPIGRGHEEKGYYKDVHASNLSGEDLQGAHRPRRESRPPRSRTWSPAASSSSASRASTSAATHGSRPGSRSRRPATTIDRQCGSAQQAVNFAAALVASGVHDAAIGGGVEHMGHISFADSMSVQKEHGFAFSPELLRALQPRPTGDLGRDDRRQVGDPPLGARRDRPALPSARRPGDRGGSFRARDDPVRGQRRHLRHRPGDPPRHQPREALRAEARLQGGRQDHRRQLLPDLRRRRRRPGDDAREGRRAGSEAARPDRRRDHGRASTR